jgi:hypothetical protein
VHASIGASISAGISSGLQMHLLFSHSVYHLSQLRHHVYLLSHSASGWLLSQSNLRVVELLAKSNEPFIQLDIRFVNLCFMLTILFEKINKVLYSFFELMGLFLKTVFYYQMLEDTA